MKAVLFREHGGPETLSYEDLPEPTIGSDDVLVRVKACALNHLDIWIRQGNPAYPMTLPHVSGSDAAGIVAQVGGQVDSVTVGQRVFVSPGISCWKCDQCLAGRDNLCRSYGLVGAKTVVPCHYNTFPPIETDAQAFKSDVESATSSGVVILDPGQTHSV